MIGRNLFVAAQILLASTLLPVQAFAQTCSASFSTMAFGNVDVMGGGNTDTASNVTVSCSGLTFPFLVRVCLHLGDGSVPPSGGLRQMASGANTLGFDIYQDSGYTTKWNTASGPVAGLLAWFQTTGNTTAYGRVPGGQSTTPIGTYLNAMTGTMYWRRFSIFQPAPNCNTLTSNPTPINFNATATVNSTCTVTATNMNFGVTPTFSSTIDAQSTVQVTCTSGTPYHVRLSGGNAGATDPTQRKMSLGANQVTYGLYRNAARTLGWGSTDGVDTQPGTGTATPNVHTVYGRIPPQATPPAGTYTDTVVVVVSFL